MKKYLFNLFLLIVIVFNTYGQGCSPQFTNLVKGPNDTTLYGLTAYGGANDKGVLFKYNLHTKTYTKLIDFDGSNGANPFGSLYYCSSNGYFYGTTCNGGTLDLGVIFKYNINQNSLTVLYEFNSLSGSHPKGGLINISDSRNPILYGVTTGGNCGNAGVIFKFNVNSSSFTTLIQGCDYYLYHFYGTPYLASNGKLYGLVQLDGNGYGAIWEYNFGNIFVPPSFSYTSFNGSNGYWPYGSLIESDSYLYGMTIQGGTQNYGNIFRFDFSNHIISNRYSFNSSNGRTPFGEIILNPNGLFYGLTSRGGSYDAGVIFEYDDDSQSLTVKRNFGLNGDGSEPRGSFFAYDLGSSNMIGMTSSGGNNGEGIIFNFFPDDDNYQKFYDFDCSDDKNLLPMGISGFTYKNINIYPNPTTNYIIINNAENSIIEIYNILGNEVKKENVISNECKIDLTELSNGNYFVKIIQEHKVDIKKIIVSKP